MPGLAHFCEHLLFMVCALCRLARQMSSRYVLGDRAIPEGERILGGMFTAGTLTNVSLLKHPLM